MTKDPTMGKHLVLVGGGHAHLTALQRLGEYVARGHRVSLVNPTEHHYYSGMGPGLLAGLYAPDQVRFHVRRLAEAGGAAFVPDRVVRIEAARKLLLLASGARLSYDIASFNIGSRIPDFFSVDPSSRVIPVKPIDGLYRARQQILSALTAGPLQLVVVGGGAAGVELCGGLWRLLRDSGGRAELTLVAGRSLLAGFPSRVRRLARASLRQRGVRILEGVRCRAMEGSRLLLDNGDLLDGDLVLSAVGVAPPPIFTEAQLPVGDDGGLLVDAHLRCVGVPELFGGGDCIWLRDRPLPRIGVHAVRQSPILYHNLLAALEDRPLVCCYRPRKRALQLLNLGDGRAILQRGRLVLAGRWAWRLKDWIDRRFMARFQPAEGDSETEPKD
ncbi:MAG: FAD-dependent oxidoreductase [Desulfuromonadaceae bacterium]